MTTKFVPRPESFTVGITQWEILWLDGEEWDAQHLQDDADGATFSARRKVYVRIRGEAPERQYQEVLLHELLHVTWAESYLENLPWPEESHDREEMVVGVMAGPLLMILVQNPQLVKWLQSDGNRRAR